MQIHTILDCIYVQTQDSLRREKKNLCFYFIHWFRKLEVLLKQDKKASDKWKKESYLYKRHNKKIICLRDVLFKEVEKQDFNLVKSDFMTKLSL